MSVVGLILVVATVIGYFGGSWVGGKLAGETGRTWGGMGGALIGIVGGFIEVFRSVARYTKELEEENGEK